MLSILPAFDVNFMKRNINSFNYAHIFHCAIVCPKIAFSYYQFYRISGIDMDFMKKSGDSLQTYCKLDVLKSINLVQ